jgi:hypothetical protein
MKTAVERGCSNAARTAIANTARAIDTHVVAPPRKLQAIGNKINCVATAGARLHRLPKNTPRATTNSNKPKQAIRTATPTPKTARDMRICPISVAAYPTAISASIATRIAATTRVSGRRPKGVAPASVISAVLSREEGVQPVERTAETVTGPKCEPPNARKSCIASQYLKVLGARVNRQCRGLVASPSCGVLRQGPIANS